MTCCDKLRMTLMTSCSTTKSCTRTRNLNARKNSAALPREPRTMKKRKNLILKRYIFEPIHRVGITLYVSRDPVVTYNRVARSFGLEKDLEFAALCISDGKGDFAMFFNKALRDDETSHEIRHLADLIMSHVGHEPYKCPHCDKPTERDEPVALLTGFLTRWVNSAIKKVGLKMTGDKVKTLKV